MPSARLWADGQLAALAPALPAKFFPRSQIASTKTTRQGIKRQKFPGSRRAELRRNGRFQPGNDSGRVVGDFPFGEGGFATLECYSDHQRIFSGRNILATKQIGGFYRIDF